VGRQERTWGEPGEQTANLGQHGRVQVFTGMAAMQDGQAFGLIQGFVAVSLD